MPPAHRETFTEVGFACKSTTRNRLPIGQPPEIDGPPYRMAWTDLNSSGRLHVDLLDEQTYIMRVVMNSHDFHNTNLFGVNQTREDNLRGC